MKADIKEKLRQAFLKDYFEESDVVYILSRIRKILEIDGKKAKYKKLKFYCDWALHAEIDNIDPISDELMNFPDDLLDSHNFLAYKGFHKEINIFLKEYNIQTNIYKNFENLLNFSQKLTDIYSDTPLIVKSTKKKKIIIKGGELKVIKKNGLKVYISPVRFTVTDGN